MTERSPTRLSSVLASVAALVAVTLPGMYSWLALGIGAVGLVVLVSGVLAGRQAAVTVGASIVFVAVLVAGLENAPAFVLLTATVLAILAWDSASTALSLGEQLGRDAPTGRIEVVHLTATAAVGTGAIAVVYGTSRVAGGDGSFTAVVFLLLAAVLIASALR